MREAAFLAINLAFAALFALRLRWTIFLAVPFALQQAMSHGLALLAAAKVGQFDGASIAVLLFLPAMLACALTLWKRPRQ